MGPKWPKSRGFDFESLDFSDFVCYDRQQWYIAGTGSLLHPKILIWSKLGPIWICLQIHLSTFTQTSFFILHIMIDNNNGSLLVASVVIKYIWAQNYGRLDPNLDQSFKMVQLANLSCKKWNLRTFNFPIFIIVIVIRELILLIFHILTASYFLIWLI